ncbi:TadE/TadG family type IV pilus assembly protein, partial [Bradyrhizobium sp. NBAIM08]|nr:pilus assembly protein [Bradyrhizobium sp. NBAIM08]
MSASARRRSHGQSLVEFALVLPIFLLLLLGLFDAGRMVYMNSTLS